MPEKNVQLIGNSGKKLEIAKKCLEKLSKFRIVKTIESFVYETYLLFCRFRFFAVLVCKLGSRLHLFQVQALYIFCSRIFMEFTGR